MDPKQAAVLTRQDEQKPLSQIEQIKQKLKSNLNDSQIAFNHQKDLEKTFLAQRSDLEPIYQKEKRVTEKLAADLTQLKIYHSKGAKLQTYYLKAQQNILELKSISNLLLVNSDKLNSETDFWGEDWYLPTSSVGFEKVKRLMNWTQEQSDSWQHLFEQSQLFHQVNEGEWSISTYLSNSYQYLKDIFVFQSPRETLLSEIDARIYQLNTEFDDNHAQLDVYAKEIKQCEIKLNKHAQSLELLNTQINKIDSDLVKIQELLKKHHASLIENSYLSKFVEYNRPFEKVLKLHDQWCHFLTKQQPVVDPNQPSITYEQICKYQNTLNQVIAAQQKEISSLKYQEKLKQLQHVNLDIASATLLLKPLLDFMETAQYLLQQHTTLKNHYDLLHDEFFIKHKKILEENQTTAEAKRLALDQEKNLLKDKFKNYLGNEIDKGDLSRYLEQRNKTYWWFDFFQAIVSVLTSWLTGFITDKARRTHYINWELRPALETYQYTGNNANLAQVLTPQSTQFFKPRTREPHSYHLSLEYMIENIRHEFFSKEQTKVYLYDVSTFNPNSLSLV